MENIESQDLLDKYNKGICTEEEKAIVESWFLNWQEVSIGPTEEQLENINQDVWESILRTELQIKKINWPLRIAGIAATLIILLSIAVLVLKHDPRRSQLYATDINPGGNKATLQLANGKLINLSETKDGLIIDSKSATYKDGAVIANIDNTGIQIMSTPKGGQYQIELPDGSKVWLNAASTLEYPVSLLESGERRVKLSGEAYFEITKDKKRPFVVETNQQTVQVLGTHFNINAYGDDESTKTTLIEGSVKVSVGGRRPGLGQDGVVLKPNEQSINISSVIKVKHVDPNEAIAWKNGEFAFNNEPLSSIMPKLARWYDVDVSYQNAEIAKKRLNGSISKFGKISEILAMLEITGEVHFKIEGRRITVMP
jgi:transmembrane sensor